MKKFITKATLALLAVFLALPAVAQQGLYTGLFPWMQQVQPSGVYYVCPASLFAGTSSIATCVASPVAITSDQAGAVPISQTTGVPLGNGAQPQIQFYAPAGIYTLLVQTTGPSPAFGTALAPLNKLYAIAVSGGGASTSALGDGYFVVSPGSCAVAASANASAGNSTLVADGASFTPAMEGTTSAAATQTISCLINVPSRLTAGAGIVINNVQLEYGVQTTAFTSTTAPILSTIAFPAPGTSETPSTVTPVAVPGALTVNPVIGSANLATTTAGAYYDEQVTLATPFAVNTDRQNLYFQQGFVQSAAAASVLKVPGLIVHYNVAGQ